MKRRSFIGIAAVGGAIPFGWSGRSQTAMPDLSGPRLSRFLVVDGRFPRAKAISASLSPGASVLEIAGDVTAIWYHTLEPAWRSSAVAVEGVTAHDALFCLGELARDHGLRVLRHAPIDRSDASLAHWLILSRSMPA